MPKLKARKHAELEALNSDLKASESFILAKYQGVPVKEIDALRRELRAAGVEFRVIKRTLLEKALQSRQAAIPGVREMSETVGVAIASSDDLAPAKVLAAFAKKNDKLSLVAGYLHGQVLSATEVKALAALPGKKDLQAQLVSVLTGSMRGLVQVLAANPRGLVQVLQAKAAK